MVPQTPTWPDHVEKWRECRLCPLAEQRNRICIARGTIPATVLFLGEAPGASEDAIGLPFVGPAGQLLDNETESRPGIVQRALPCHLEWSEQKRTNVWVMDIAVAFVNLVCCFPREAKAAGDSEPTHEEILACRPRLEEFIRLAQPKLVVTVGSLATGYYRWDGVTRTIDIVHPAAILRMPLAQKQMAAQKTVVVLRNTVENILRS